MRKLFYTEWIFCVLLDCNFTPVKRFYCYMCIDKRCTIVLLLSLGRRPTDSGAQWMHPNTYICKYIIYSLMCFNMRVFFCFATRRALRAWHLRLQFTSVLFTIITIKKTIVQNIKLSNHGSVGAEFKLELVWFDLFLFIDYTN